MNSATSAYWKRRLPTPRSAPIRQKIGPIRFPGTRARTSAPTVANASEATTNDAPPRPVRTKSSAGVAWSAATTSSTLVTSTTAAVATRSFTVSLLSHSETCAGCTVSPTTTAISPRSASRSSSSRSRAPNASSVSVAS